MVWGCKAKRGGFPALSEVLHSLERVSEAYLF